MNPSSPLSTRRYPPRSPTTMPTVSTRTPHPSKRPEPMDSPYDLGYASCPCFWGRRPGRLVSELTRVLPSWHGLSVLDVGCGEGKNAAFVAKRGAIVRAVEVSPLALRNAIAAWPNLNNITWEHADVRDLTLPSDRYDVILAYGLLHCLATESEVRQIVEVIQYATTAGGFNVICAFNGRSQDLSAHPRFAPVLLAHDDYVRLYDTWQLLHSTDSDLHEVHPHNEIPHTHSMTRLIARKPAHDYST